ncbi:MAG TPA: Gfo/Idh/MocA family oxidoreductase [Chthoniobacteraceae bacterium]|nr:Gfo/Idh/MocA family oxidoreductase [Chthoniobacteraceae bacterium]
MNRRHFITTTLASTLAFAAGAAESERKLRVAIIGHTGHGNYGHGLDTMWLRLPETEVAGVADADAAGLAAELKKLKIERGFADYRQMLAETKPDIVAVAPRELAEHRDMALAAIETGARGIYMEKPFCRTLAEADEIIAACEKRGVKLALAHRNRYNPSVPVLDKLLAGDAIGRLIEIRARGKEDARGGSLDLWVLGSHVLNLAVHFSGKPVACAASILQGGRPITRDDVKDGAEGVGPLAGNEVHARFETEGGVTLFFDSVANAGDRVGGFGLQIIGAKGVIDLRMDSLPMAQLLASSPLAPAKEPRTWTPITSGGVGQPEPIADIKEQVTDHLLPGRDLIAAMRENREPLCSARDGRAVVEMITAVFESQRLNGQRVPFPLQVRGNPLAAL